MANRNWHGATPSRQISRPTRLGLSVYDVLLERLTSREIPPGARISVDNLVRELGVSQTPIRDALSQLEAQGLVTKTHLVGFHAAPAFTWTDFESLYEFRRLVEPESAFKAAENVASGTFESFDDYSEAIKQAQADTGSQAYNRFARTDVAFHSLVAKNSGNRFLYETIASTNLQFHLFRQGYNPHWVPEVIEEHAEIMERILVGDSKGARRAMIQHLDSSHLRYQSTTNDRR